MTTNILETDYLIIGSGAVGMAFVDTILAETNSTVLLVDKHDKPGGHWNDAYPFVTLHQPSAFYGVNSKNLGGGKKDKTGLNKGLYELATGQEVSDYFVDLMNETFLPSGRVQYFPECEVKENSDGFFSGDGDDGYHIVTSLKSDETFKVKVSKKIVDATYFKTSVPSTHTPNFSIDPAIKDAGQFIILNDLPKTTLNFDEYVVVGAGKTAMDAIIWMLENKDIQPDQITWIMSRDSWLIDRENTQPASEFFRNSIGSIADQMHALANAESIDDLFDRLDKSGALIRIDENVKPMMFHGATISRAELDELRRVKNIVRMGRVKSLHKGNMVMDKGDKAVADNTLFIDCSALPNHYYDWIKVTYTNMLNQYTWGREPGIRDWLRKSRLDGFTDMVQSTKPYHLRRMLILRKFRDSARPAMANAKKFMQELGQL